MFKPSRDLLMAMQLYRYGSRACPCKKSGKSRKTRHEILITLEISPKMFSIRDTTRRISIFACKHELAFCVCINLFKGKAA